MPNYQNGMIYKLVNDENDDIYVGSTTQQLSKRLGDHKSSYKYHKKISSAFNIVKYQSCKIILIEKYPCNCKYELESRERYYIETLNCVNKNIPTRNKKDYYNDKKEHMKQYKIENKDKIKEYYKKNYINNKDKIKEYKKQYNIENKDKKNEYQKNYDLKNKEKKKVYQKQIYIYQQSFGGLLNIKMDLFL